MLAAGLGCAFFSSLAIAQPAAPLIAFHAATTLSSVSLKPAADTPTELISFCGESLPTNYPAITERWTRTLSRQAALAGHLALLKRRASVVFPIIEPILKQYRIPADFKFLPLLESALANRAVSYRGAAGFWQLMPGTAQSLGLSVSRQRDERFSLNKSTHAACRYLNELYDQLGSWMLVATAYNAGPNYISQLSRQYPGQHPMALPYRAPETKAYLFQALAVKELLTRPQAYSSYLSSRHLAALSDGATFVPLAERAVILASFDLDETAFAASTAATSTAAASTAGQAGLAFVSDSTTNVVLLTEDEADAETQPVAATPATVDTEQTVAATAPAVAQLKTRSLGEGKPTDGQLCLFQVVQPVTINGRTFAVGDVIQAYLEIVDPGSGRVFLRTDRLMTTQTRETVALKMMATEQPHQPGVALPSRLENWQLTWEAL